MGHNYPIRVLIWVIQDQSKAWFPHRSACHVCFQNYPLVLKHGNWKLYVHQILIWKRFIFLFIHASHTSKTYISIHVILDNIHMSTSIHMYNIYIYTYIRIYIYTLINGCTTIYICILYAYCRRGGNSQPSLMFPQCLPSDVPPSGKSGHGTTWWTFEHQWVHPQRTRHRLPGGFPLEIWRRSVTWSTDTLWLCNVWLCQQFANLNMAQSK